MIKPAFRKFWLVRAMLGGLWIQFRDGRWEQCSWIKKRADGYIRNHYTGGAFHLRFIEITKVEDYPYFRRKYVEKGSVSSSN